MSTAIDDLQLKFEHMERRHPISATRFCDESLVDALRKLDADHKTPIEPSKSGKARFELPETSRPAPPSALQIDSLPSTPNPGTRAIQSYDTAGADSGYASLASSNQGSRENSTSTKAGKFFGDFLVKSKTKLRSYDNDIPDTVRDRFLDLKELFNEPLLLHLRHKRLDVRSITIRLKCLGTDEHSAKPWIVVLCNPELTKEVRRYFNQKRVREELQPKYPDLPSLQVIVDSRPLTTTVNNKALDAFSEGWDSVEEFGTLCGTPIKILKDNQELYATIGGVIEVIGQDLTSRMFAMTVGHILADSAAEVSMAGYTDTSEVDSVEDGCSVCSDFSDDALEEYEIELTETDQSEELGMEKATHDFDLSTDYSEAAKDELSWSRIGKIISYHTLTNEATDNFDWALVELDDKARYLPNKVLGQGTVIVTETGFTADLDPMNEKIPWATEDDRLCLLNGRKPSQGVLRKEPTYVLLAPGTRMIEAFTMHLDEGKAVTKGDSGTWVVGVHNGLFYGHVIATDIFGDAYMVPSYDTLRDIRDRVDAVQVLLPESSSEPTFQSHEHSTEGNSMPVDHDVSYSFTAPLAMSEDHRPRADTCEDWDDDTQNTVPGSLTTANIDVKRYQDSTLISHGASSASVAALPRSDRSRPRAAYCEDWDEDIQTVLPGTRTIADVSVESDRDSVSRTHRKAYGSDGVDSGYASRATTIRSAYSSASPNRSRKADMNIDVTGIRERGRETYVYSHSKPPQIPPRRRQSSYGHGAMPPPGYATPVTPSISYIPTFGPYAPPPSSYRQTAIRLDYSADSMTSPGRTLSKIPRPSVASQKPYRSVDEDRANMPPPPRRPSDSFPTHRPSSPRLNSNNSQDPQTREEPAREPSYRIDEDDSYDEPTLTNRERRKSPKLPPYDYRPLDDRIGPRKAVSYTPGGTKTKITSSGSSLVPRRTSIPTIPIEQEAFIEDYQKKRSKNSTELTAEALRAFDERISSSKSETGSNVSRSSSPNSSERGRSSQTTGTETTTTKTSIARPGSITLPGGLSLTIPPHYMTKDGRPLGVRIGNLVVSVAPGSEGNEKAKEPGGVERAPSVASGSSKTGAASIPVSSRDTEQS